LGIAYQNSADGDIVLTLLAIAIGTETIQRYGRQVRFCTTVERQLAGNKGSGVKLASWQRMTM